MEIPMLEDHEAEVVLRPFQDGTKDFERTKQEVTDRYFKMTGFRETNPVAICIM